jgi:hypothetical protein
MQNYGLGNSTGVNAVGSSYSRYNPQHVTGQYTRAMQGRSNGTLGGGRFLHTASDPNKPIYIKIIGFFPIGSRDLLDGTMIFTDVDAAPVDKINVNLINKHPNAVICYTLKQVRELRLYGVPVGQQPRRFQPLGFAYNVSFVPNRGIGQGVVNCWDNKMGGLSEVVTFSCALSGRLQIDNVWADYDKVKLGETLLIRKIDFKPYLMSNVKSVPPPPAAPAAPAAGALPGIAPPAPLRPAPDADPQNDYFKVGVCRVNKFGGAKRGGVLNRQIDVFVSLHSKYYTYNAPLTQKRGGAFKNALQRKRLADDVKNVLSEKEKKDYDEIYNQVINPAGRRVIDTQPERTEEPFKTIQNTEMGRKNEGTVDKMAQKNTQKVLEMAERSMRKRRRNRDSDKLKKAASKIRRKTISKYGS